MAHLSVIRRGWQNEHLAAFLLSKFAFVASPVKVGDDLGADFFCTYFDTLTEKEKEYLIPRNSFAIQVKSSGRIIEVTKQIKYFLGLELPFFIGIVNQEKSNITIYSGEYLPIFLHHVKLGELTSLKLKLCPNHNFSLENYFINNNDPNKYKLLCPKVATLSTKMNNNDIVKETKFLIETAKRTHKNISSVVNNEYIFETGANGNVLIILAGSGSNKVFRDNFKKRLAEVFYNLDWIYNSRNKDFDINEFYFYETFYNKMLAREGSVPSDLANIVRKLKEKIEKA